MGGRRERREAVLRSLGAGTARVGAGVDRLDWAAIISGSEPKT